MKKLLLLLSAVCVSFTAVADEGMWLLPYLQKMNSKDMKAKGCKLSAEDIYSINQSSLKDAIVVFGGGCTGEIVSPDGLLFTNHHCGYGSIQSLSSVEHDYLKNGFWAQSRAEEIPAPGLKVRFIRKITDVTSYVLGQIPDLASGEERKKMVERNAAAIREQLSNENPGMTVFVENFFGGNQYFAFVSEVYNDVRLVGTPPTSIGKFGGETDNWMWPRHTGDFSIFRVYAGADNRPAEYAPENKPYTADKFLKISLAGYNEGDFAMIMGFPGSTERYMTSHEIDRMLEVENPQRIFIRGERQQILKKDMEANDTVRIQYASKYAGSSNYWKNSIGMSRGLKKLNVKAKKQAQEQAFQLWAEKNTLPDEGFIDALPMIRRSVEESWQANAALQYIREALMNAVELTKPAIVLGRTSVAPEAVESQTRFAEGFYKDFDPRTDRRVAYRMLEITRENCKDLPTFFKDEIEAKFGGDVRAYVDYLYDNSVFASKQKALAYIGSDSVAKQQLYDNDPAVAMARSVSAKFEELGAAVEAAEAVFADGHRLYIAGLMRMQPNKAWASDANSTIRLTYGRVFPYEPADGILYNYYTTLKGVIEKEDATNPTEFTVPEKLKELYAARDYGQYANSKGELPVAFLSDLDITGGNSGSPILNARGELIGLAFDGNWEAMSGDVAFEPELQRTISVDVRYLLFVIDKFAGAGWLLDEMELVRK